MIVAGLVGLGSCPSFATPGPDWSARLRTDAQGLHDDIAANHPGMANDQDPGFAAHNDSQLRLALQRARQIHDYAGYLFALRGYTASFDDVHVEFVAHDPRPELPTAWPGFLTGWSPDNVQRVVVRAADAPLPIGAILQGCDGLDAASLAQRNLAPFAGRWMLATQRIRYSGDLLLDQGNPFIQRPVACSFTVDGRPRRITLEWRALSPDDVDAKRAETAPRARPETGFEKLSDGSYWISLPDFASDPAAKPGRELVGLLAELRRRQQDLHRAPWVVLDLRGNNGGSSDWSNQVARILWGDASVDTVGAWYNDFVQWRASTANARTMGDALIRLNKAPGMSANDLKWVAAIAAGLDAALKTGHPLWREPALPPTRRMAPAPPPDGLVYVLTDFRCASACLDAVDLWRALGAVQIGQQTAADTYYLDARIDTLPAGIASLEMPMKVYRNRARGNNVPWTPTYPYGGDMRDTSALRTWVRDLPR